MYSLQRTLKRFKLISLTKKHTGYLKLQARANTLYNAVHYNALGWFSLTYKKSRIIQEQKAPKWNGISPENWRIPLSRSGQHNRRTPGLQSVFFNVLERFDQWRYAICNNWYRDCFGYFAYHVDVNRLPRPFVLFSVSNKMTTKQI